MMCREGIGAHARALHRDEGELHGITGCHGADVDGFHDLLAVDRVDPTRIALGRDAVDGGDVRAVLAVLGGDFGIGCLEHGKRRRIGCRYLDGVARGVSVGIRNRRLGLDELAGWSACWLAVAAAEEEEPCALAALDDAGAFEPQPARASEAKSAQAAMHAKRRFMIDLFHPGLSVMAR